MGRRGWDGHEVRIVWRSSYHSLPCRPIGSIGSLGESSGCFIYTTYITVTVMAIEIDIGIWVANVVGVSDDEVVRGESAISVQRTAYNVSIKVLCRIDLPSRSSGVEVRTNGRINDGVIGRIIGRFIAGIIGWTIVLRLLL